MERLERDLTYKEVKNFIQAHVLEESLSATTKAEFLAVYEKLSKQNAALSLAFVQRLYYVERESQKQRDFRSAMNMTIAGILLLILGYMLNVLQLFKITVVVLYIVGTVATVFGMLFVASSTADTPYPQQPIPN